MGQAKNGIPRGITSKKIMITKELILNLADEAFKMPIPDWLRVAVHTPSDCETPYHRFLFLLAKEFRGGEFVELGTREGIGAMALSHGNPLGNIFTFDIQDLQHQACKRENIFFYRQDSCQIPLAIPSKIDILFIDTEHDGNRPLIEFESWKHFIPVGGVIIFDDVELNDSMKDFWHNFNPSGYEKFDLPKMHTSGFGILIKQSE